MAVSKKHLKDLCQLLAAVDNEQEAALLLEDMFTPAERDSLCERWQLVQELHKGKPQRQIAEELGLSISKITKCSDVLKRTWT